MVHSRVVQRVRARPDVVRDMPHEAERPVMLTAAVLSTFVSVPVLTHECYPFKQFIGSRPWKVRQKSPR